MAYMTDIQQAAQAALPVIPNNGNPGGAYNMPQPEAYNNVKSMSGDDAPAQHAGNPLAWIEPSDYMRDISQLLEYQSVQLQRQFNEKQQLFNYVPRGNGLSLQAVDDNGLPSVIPDAYGGGVREEPVIPISDQVPPVMPSTDIVIPQEYKQALYDGRIR